MSRRARLALVDQGSTATKAALATAGQGLDSVREAPTTTHRRDGRVELDAGEVADTVAGLLSEITSGEPIDGVGLTCQRSTCLLWTRDEARPLAPALSWQDRSAADLCEALVGNSDTIARRTGLRLSPHYAASKLSLLLDEIPGARQRAEAGEIVAGTLDAFLTHRLTGHPTTDPGHAGRTLLYDLEVGHWDDELCGLFGVPRASLPELRPSVGDRGATATGPLVAVVGDQQAALVGHGGWQPGVVAAHFGTGAFVLASTGGQLRRHDGLLSAVVASTANRVTFQLEGSVNSAGAAVDWIGRVTGRPIDTWVDRPLEPEALPWVLPSFSGAAAPWWRAGATGVYAGLDLDTDADDLMAATLCGVAQRVVDCVETLAEADLEIATLRVSGKLTRFDGLVDLLANLSGRSVEVTRGESGLAGLALLAETGVSGDDSRLSEAPPVATRREPVWGTARRDAVRRSWRRRVEAVLATTAEDLP